MKSFKRILLVGSAGLLPLLVFAQQSGTFGCGPVSGGLKNLFCLLTEIVVFSVIPLIGVVGLAWFFYGVAKYIKGAEDEKGRTEGRQFMLYGIIALFVMVSVIGLVNVLRNTFGFNSAGFFGPGQSRSIDNSGSIPTYNTGTYFETDQYGRSTMP